MTITRILKRPPGFTFEERQILIRRAIELDEPLLTEDDEALVESRLMAHHLDPNSAMSCEDVKRRVRSRQR